VSREFLEKLLVEGGPVETASAWLYFVAAGYLLLKSRRYSWSTGPAGAVILSACGFRKLDFQYRLTSGYVLGTRYYLAGTAPGWELLIVVSVLAGLAVVTMRFVWLNWSGFVEGFRQSRRSAIAVAAALGLMFLATFLDLAQSYLRRNYPASTDAGFSMWFLEETLELIVPGLFVAAIFEAAAESERRHSSRASARRLTRSHH